MLPNTLRPLVTDNETTTTLNTKKTRPKRVVKALHHCRFRFALAIVRPKRSACVTSSVKSKSSPKPRTAKRRFQSFALNEAIVPSVDDPTSLHSSCWNNSIHIVRLYTLACTSINIHFFIYKLIFISI